MKIAIIGATGLVGRKIIEILQERDIPVKDLIPAASLNSAGKTIHWKGHAKTILTISEALAKHPHIALFSAGSDISEKWAPLFAAQGCKVIDNSSKWRNNPDIKLIVPEINGDTLNSTDMIISNPNCSTIQMVVALNLLHSHFKIKRIVVTTYQSVSGSGIRGINQLEAERHNTQSTIISKAYDWPIDYNLIPQIGSMEANGFTSEEMKMINETRKIFNDYTIEISPTTVRVPVTGGHSESLNIEFYHEFTTSQAVNLLLKTPGLQLMSENERPPYPMPLYCKDKDTVYAGRIRKDIFSPCTLNMWVVADNLRKGAATNAVQIAQLLMKNS